MEDSLKRRTIASLFWKLFERFGNSVVALVVQIVMARLLTPSDFGLLAIMLVFVTISDTIMKSGLTSALVQAPEVTERDFSTIFWIMLLLAIVLYVVVFFLAPVIAIFYESSAIIWPLRALALVLPVNAFNAIQWAKISRDLVFKKSFISTLVSVVVSGAAGIALAFAGAGLWALVLQQLILALVGCVVLRIQISWSPMLVFDPKRARKHFSFGWKLLVSGLITTCFQGLQSLIIGKQFNTANLGFVSQGEKYPNAIGRMIDGAIQPVMMSAVARVQDDLAYVRRLLRRSIRTAAFFVFPIMGLMALVAEPLVLILLGEKWLPCVPFLQMYCFVYAQLAFQSSSLQTLNGMGRSDIFLKLDIVNKVVGVIVLLIASFGFQSVYAIVIGAMLCGVQASVLDVYPNTRILGYSYLEVCKDTLPAFAITLISCAIALPIACLGLAPSLTVVLQFMVMVAAYFVLAKLFRLEELEYLLDTVKSELGERITKGK